jgi:hypothetical protein
MRSICRTCASLWTWHLVNPDVSYGLRDRLDKERYLLEAVLVPHLPFAFEPMSALGPRNESVRLTMPGSTISVYPILIIKEPGQYL